MLSGCATISHGYLPPEYDIQHKLKGLDDQDALELGCAICNVKAEDRDKEIAKNIAIGKYLKELKKRKSPLIEESGMLEIKYEKINLKKFGNAEIIRLFRSLDREPFSYKTKTIAELTKDEESEKIVYVTAMNELLKEARRRQVLNQGLDLVMKMIGIAASILVLAL